MSGLKIAKIVKKQFFPASRGSSQLSLAGVGLGPNRPNGWFLFGGPKNGESMNFVGSYLRAPVEFDKVLVRK